ncbi:protein bric-a-brac 1 isoform X2 [Halyomorpha halys]|uniref:protein bric-a-brac 1 isoform X2 n=1 Tax=Halyomorpha halys TaxID=286706 RepID=UPI0006D50B27|nr:protein bric-a-brac 1-like isoform X2 [Halyomorpha halys]
MNLIFIYLLFIIQYTVISYLSFLISASIKVKMVFYSSGLEEEMAGQHYCLRWNNYQSNMTSVFHHLLRTQAFVDVTLACNDQSLKAHKVVLSACSSYFQKLLLENPCKHPTIIMPQDVCFADLKFIIEFVYKGEIDVSQAQLQSVLKTADQLKIKGLCEVPEGKEGAEVTPLPHRRTLSIRQRRLARRRLQYRQRLARQKASILPSEGIALSGSRIQYGATLAQTPSGTHSDVGTSTDDQENKDVIGDTTLVVASPLPEVTQKVTPQVVVSEHESDANESTASIALVSAVDIPQGATHRDIAVDASDLPAEVGVEEDENVKVKFETLRAIDQAEHMDMEHMPDRGVEAVGEEGMHTMMITPELLGLIPSSQSEGSDTGSISKGSANNTIGSGGKSWRQEDMEAALEALRQGIETPKKDGPLKTWTEDNLNVALDALRTGSISANKASKAYGIPSSTLYKIARREGIRLAAPFNAAPTSWAPEDLERALESIRSGQSTVQRAAAEYGIPSGTLYGRCKREGIELSRANPTPWSEAAMNQALDAVRIGQMSINQAAIHFNLPYSSLYGRFKRGKYDGTGGVEETNGSLEATGAEGTAELLPTSQSQPQIMLVQYQQPIHMYQPT